MKVFIVYAHLESMKTVMLGDRLYDRVKRKEFILLDGMARQDANLRERNWHKHLETSYRAGRDFLTLGCMVQE
jgi:NAD(P)H dehydrogenase (quinone)